MECAGHRCLPLAAGIISSVAGAPQAFKGENGTCDDLCHHEQDIVKRSTSLICFTEIALQHLSAAFLPLEREGGGKNEPVSY